MAKYRIIDSQVRIGEDFSFYFPIKHTPEDQIALMDECGIEKAVSIPYADPPSIQKGFIRANNLALEIAEKFPRLIPFAQVDPRESDAEKELRRAVKLGAKGVRIFSYHLGPCPDADYMKPIVEAAIDIDVPVMLFCDFNEKFAHPYRIIRLAQKFPKVRIIMESLGGVDTDVTWFLADIYEMAGKPCNLILDTSSPHEMTYVLYEQLISSFGAENIVFGSGAPLFHPKLAIRKLELARISENDRELIFGKNLARILKID